jgi:hypothetical protein
LTSQHHIDCRAGPNHAVHFESPAGLTHDSVHLRAFNLPEREIARVLRIAARTVKSEPAAKRALRPSKVSRKERLRAS